MHSRGPSSTAEFGWHSAARRRPALRAAPTYPGARPSHLYPYLPSDLRRRRRLIASQVSAFHQGAKLRDHPAGAMPPARSCASSRRARAARRPCASMAASTVATPTSKAWRCPDAVRQVLARRPRRDVGGPAREPGCRRRRACGSRGGAHDFTGDTTLGDVARCAASCGSCARMATSAGLARAARPRRSGALSPRRPPPAAVGAEWVLASGCTATSLRRQRGRRCSPRLERWRTPLRCSPRSAPQVPATVKVGDIVPAARRPRGCRRRRGRAGQRRGRRGFSPALRSRLVGNMGATRRRASDHGGSRLLDFVNTWRPSSFRVLALSAARLNPGVGPRRRRRGAAGVGDVVADRAGGPPRGRRAATSRGSADAGRIMRSEAAGPL